MAWLKLKNRVATTVNADLNDIVNAKLALSNLGYYPQSTDGNYGAWVDSDLFKGIRNFQKDSGLKVDGDMKPGGATELLINHRLGSIQPRSTNLSSLEHPTMCACQSSDDNPWPTT